MATESEETRVLARLPHVDLAVVHRRPRDGRGDQILVAVQLAPSARLGDASALVNPFFPWLLLGPTLWSSWLGLFAQATAEARRSGRMM